MLRFDISPGGNVGAIDDRPYREMSRLCIGFRLADMMRKMFLARCNALQRAR